MGSAIGTAPLHHRGDVALEIPFDPPDPEQVYRNYLKTCHRLGVEPVSRDRAQELMTEWSDAIAGCGAVPPIKHWPPAPRVNASASRSAPRVADRAGAAIAPSASMRYVRLAR